MARGLSHRLQTNDEKEYDRLNWSPPTAPVAALEVVCLGAVKKVALGSFVAFDFRLRAIGDSGPVKAGQRLTWSAVFPLKPGMDIPPEGFLHLPQKQKFAPNLFLEQKTVSIQNAGVTADESAARVSLNEQSKVTIGHDFADWNRFLDWSPAPALQRLSAHKPGPLDLDTELQEEVILSEYQIGTPADGDEPGQTIYPVTAGALTLHAVVGTAEGKALRKGIDDLRKLKKERPPLFGLMHYERCRLGLSTADRVRQVRTGLPDDLEREHQQGGAAEGDDIYLNGKPMAKKPELRIRRSPASARGGAVCRSA